MNEQSGGEGTYPTFESVIQDQTIDAVVITSPPDVHAEQVVAGLKSGKVVLVEKPMCLDRGEMEAIGHAPTERLMVAENYDFKPSLGKLRSWVEARRSGNGRADQASKVHVPLRGRMAIGPRRSDRGRDSLRRATDVSREC